MFLDLMTIADLILVLFELMCGKTWCFSCCILFFFQAEDGIRDLVRSRGLGDVYKRQLMKLCARKMLVGAQTSYYWENIQGVMHFAIDLWSCLLYTSDAADERSSVDLGGRRIIKKKKHDNYCGCAVVRSKTIKRRSKEDNESYAHKHSSR